ncbi:uncharacterized protein TrAtP1_011844 [Trichoderma atroviride]|uniref:uncharacterized protein n=1 Tax=Hypocrea atroviridis TaxID=63577 RepID=UPI003322C04A|nr:hypothetical protein TrAtP1_011844 [Trichoderma atroviride]
MFSDCPGFGLAVPPPDYAAAPSPARITTMSWRFLSLRGHVPVNCATAPGPARIATMLTGTPRR